MAIVKRRIDPANAPKLSKKQLAQIDALSLDEIERRALADADNPPMTDEELAKARFARRVKRARKKSGLSQAQFAARFNINESRLRDWEHGRFRPDSVSSSYIRVIEYDAALVQRALEHA